MTKKWLPECVYEAAKGIIWCQNSAPFWQNRVNLAVISVNSGFERV